MGFCPQASPTEDVPCPLSRPLWGPKTPLTLKAPTERKLPPPAPLGVAGASLDGQQMEQLPSLSSLPGLPSQRPGKSGEGGLVRRPLPGPTRGETFHKESPQAPSPTELSLLGQGPPKREGMWGCAQPPREHIHVPGPVSEEITGEV